MGDLSKAVKRAMELYQHTKNYTEIARLLNEEGYTTSKGYKFKRGYVSNLLSYAKRGIDPIEANKRKITEFKEKQNRIRKKKLKEESSKKNDSIELIELILSSGIKDESKVNAMRAILGGDNA